MIEILKLFGEALRERLARNEPEWGVSARKPPPESDPQ